MEEDEFTLKEVSLATSTEICNECGSELRKVHKIHLTIVGRLGARGVLMTVEDSYRPEYLGGIPERARIVFNNFLITGRL